MTADSPNYFVAFYIWGFVPFLIKNYHEESLLAKARLTLLHGLEEEYIHLSFSYNLKGPYFEYCYLESTQKLCDR